MAGIKHFNRAHKQWLINKKIARERKREKGDESKSVSMQQYDMICNNVVVNVCNFRMQIKKKTHILTRLFIISFSHLLLIASELHC